ncbi:MAG TPA: PaeR7I family type II restriction endonuclease, partial [Candidatus Binataceae bacterium]|nr:PaeR7I family type II restriction endonuclease [Candidatus Binataceae bacterium]
MPIRLPPFHDKLREAVAHYWNTLSVQSDKQRAGEADRGRRAAVTGGKQMDGFCRLVQWVLVENGLPEPSIYTKTDLELPGYFRPTEKWDMLIVRDSHLIAAIEFKSQRGPSFGNNLNNRTEEALGTAVDLWTAYREGA